MSLTSALAGSGPADPGTAGAGAAGPGATNPGAAGSGPTGPGATGPEARRRRGRGSTLVRARSWLTVERASLACLLVATGLLYLVGLSASGYANEFYAAAAQAGSQSWSAFLWGASDAAGSITVDKPPASLWLPALFVRIFGLSSWAILVPQAIMGVLSVWLLYAILRRDFGHWSALLGGTALATTPVACLMFRFNNPDALLILLMLSATYCVMRAIACGGESLHAEKRLAAERRLHAEKSAQVENDSRAGYAPRVPCDDRLASRARTLWMALAGVAMGFAFLTKQLQAFLVLPGLGVAFLVASPTSVRRRLLDSAVALGAMVLAAGWWVALTVVVPADMRPYFGGSDTNSFVELTFWYNGLGRIFGNTVGSGSMARQGILMGTGGEASLARLLTGVWATQWSWLFWAALAGLAVVIGVSGRVSRTDRRRAQAIVWGGWLAVTFLVFSFMEGTIHQYYTVALAPAVAALAAAGARVLWEKRERAWARAVAAAVVVASTVWACVLVSGTEWFVQALVAGVVVLAGGALVLMAAGEASRRRAGVAPAWLPRASACLAIASCLLVPVAHSLYTASTGHHGSIVTAGPSVTGADAMGGVARGAGRLMGGGGGNAPGGNAPSNGGAASDGGPSRDGGNAPGGSSAPGDGNGMPGGPGDGGNAPSNGGAAPGGGNAPGGNVITFGGNGASSVSDEVTALLLDDADSYTWVAAAVGSQGAASYQLATERSVMPIGGFNGTDPSPTLDEFRQYVAEGRIHYFIAGGRGAGPGASSDEESIAEWVAENFSSTTVDGVTLYDLTQPLS